MSAKGVESVLARVSSDADFFERLFGDASKTLSGFDLTEEEIETFKSLTREEIQLIAGDMDAQSDGQPVIHLPR